MQADKDSLHGSGGDTEELGAVDLAWEVMDKLITLGQEISEQAEERGELKRSHAQLVASDQLCLYLADSTEYLTVADYLDYYDKPIDLILEEELVWPMPATVMIGTW